MKGRVLTLPAFMNSLTDLDSRFTWCIFSNFSMCLNHVASLRETKGTNLVFSVTKSGLAAHLLKNLYSQKPGERKVAFNQNAGNLGRWWTQCPPKTISEDSAQPWKFLKGKREVISVNHWDGGSESSPSPTACRLVDSSWSLDAVLFTQFVREITEGAAREEIQSSVNYLFFISTSLIYGRSQEIRQDIVWLKDLKGVLWPEMSRAPRCLV